MLDAPAARDVSTESQVDGLGIGRECIGAVLAQVDRVSGSEGVVIGGLVRRGEHQPARKAHHDASSVVSRPLAHKVTHQHLRFGIQGSPEVHLPDIVSLGGGFNGQARLFSGRT
jgi:hypothetical protein